MSISRRSFFRGLLAGSAASAIASVDARPAPATGIVTGNTLGSELCKALDINVSRVVNITINCEAGKIATVQLERFMTSEEGRRIAATVRDEYTLTRK